MGIGSIKTQPSEFRPFSIFWAGFRFLEAQPTQKLDAICVSWNSTGHLRKWDWGSPHRRFPVMRSQKRLGLVLASQKKGGGFVFFQIVGFCGDHTSNDGDGSLPCGFGTNRIGVPLVLVAQITSLWGEPAPLSFFFFGVRLAHP